MRNANTWLWIDHHCGRYIGSMLLIIYRVQFHPFLVVLVAVRFFVYMQCLCIELWYSSGYKGHWPLSSCWSTDTVRPDRRFVHRIFARTPIVRTRDCFFAVFSSHSSYFQDSSPRLISNAREVHRDSSELRSEARSRLRSIFGENVSRRVISNSSSVSCHLSDNRLCLICCHTSSLHIAAQSSMLLSLCQCGVRLCRLSGFAHVDVHFVAVVFVWFTPSKSLVTFEHSSLFGVLRSHRVDAHWMSFHDILRAVARECMWIFSLSLRYVGGPQRCDPLVFLAHSHLFFQPHSASSSVRRLFPDESSAD